MILPGGIEEATSLLTNEQGTVGQDPKMILPGRLVSQEATSLLTNEPRTVGQDPEMILPGGIVLQERGNY
jgi:hypothetical protein